MLSIGGRGIKKYEVKTSELRHMSEPRKTTEPSKCQKNDCTC